MVTARELTQVLGDIAPGLTYIRLSEECFAEPAMSDAKPLYETDVVLWSEQQAAALRSGARSGSNLDLDWENLAEEIESVGRSERHELKSQIHRIIEHLLKLEHSSARYPRRGWVRSIDDARDAIERIVEDSPSLRGEIDVFLRAETKRAIRRAIKDLRNYGEIDPVVLVRMQNATYTPEQVVDDWFPPEPEGQA